MTGQLTDSEIIEGIAEIVDLLQIVSYDSKIRKKQGEENINIANSILSYLKDNGLLKPAEPPLLSDDVCVCGHNIHEHEAVHECKCYAYGCDCDGYEVK